MSGKQIFVLLCTLALGGSTVLAQVSPEEAMKRLRERQQKAAPATAPTTQEASAVAAKPEPANAAGAAIHQLVTDLDTAAERGADQATISASFGNLVGKTFTFTGSAFGIASTVPFPQAQGKRAILVTLSVPPSKSIDAAARRHFAAVRQKFDTEEKQMREKRKLEVMTAGYLAKDASDKNISDNNFKNELAAHARARDDAGRLERAAIPPARSVDLYLVFPDELIDAVKRGQILKGQITFSAGAADAAAWHSANLPAGDTIRGRPLPGTVTVEAAAGQFVDKVRLLATFKPAA